MSKPKRGGPAIGKAEALEILRSAVNYCRQAGLQVRAGNVSGELVLAIGGAELAGGRFAVTAQHQESQPSASDAVPAADGVTNERLP